MSECYIEPMASSTERAKYIRPDRKVAVHGWWVHRGGCLWLGEITVMIAGKVMRFSSTTVMSPDGLAGYATDDYLARFASQFRAQKEAYA